MACLVARMIGGAIFVGGRGRVSRDCNGTSTSTGIVQAQYGADTLLDLENATLPGIYPLFSWNVLGGVDEGWVGGGNRAMSDSGTGAVGLGVASLPMFARVCDISTTLPISTWIWIHIQAVEIYLGVPSAINVGSGPQPVIESTIYDSACDQNVIGDSFTITTPRHLVMP